MNIYVGNLSAKTTEDDLRQTFAVFGQVRSVNVVRDGTSGESRGLVSMPVKKEAQAAIGEMNGNDLDGQSIRVQESRAKTNVLNSTGRRAGFKRARGGGSRPRASSGGTGHGGRQGSRGRGGPGRRRH
jgi:RNA recognition motif-containing protein